MSEVRYDFQSKNRTSGQVVSSRPMERVAAPVGILAVGLYSNIALGRLRVYSIVEK